MSPAKRYPTAQFIVNAPAIYVYQVMYYLEKVPLELTRRLRAVLPVEEAERIKNEYPFAHRRAFFEKHGYNIDPVLDDIQAELEPLLAMVERTYLSRALSVLYKQPHFLAQAIEGHFAAHSARQATRARRNLAPTSFAMDQLNSQAALEEAQRIEGLTEMIGNSLVEEFNKIPQYEEMDAVLDLWPEIIFYDDELKRIGTELGTGRFQDALDVRSFDLRHGVVWDETLHRNRYQMLKGSGEVADPTVMPRVPLPAAVDILKPYRTEVVGNAGELSYVVRSTPKEYEPFNLSWGIKIDVDEHSRTAAAVRIDMEGDFGYVESGQGGTIGGIMPAVDRFESDVRIPRAPRMYLIRAHKGMNVGAGLLDNMPKVREDRNHPIRALTSRALAPDIHLALSIWGNRNVRDLADLGIPSLEPGPLYGCFDPVVNRHSVGLSDITNLQRQKNLNFGTHLSAADPVYMEQQGYVRGDGRRPGQYQRRHGATFQSPPPEL